MFLSYACYGLVLLFKAHRETTGIKQAQIKYVLAASLIGFPSGATNYFLWYGIPTPPYWNALVALFPIIITYAITKHHLFEIKVVLTELLVGIFSVFLFIQIFFSDSVWEYIWKIIIFVIFLFFGYLFIKSILKEIEMKQKIGEASWRLLEQGEKVSENFKKVMADRKNLLKEWFLSDVNKELEINSLKNRVKELEEKLREK